MEVDLERRFGRYTEVAGASIIGALVVGFGMNLEGKGMEGGSVALLRPEIIMDLTFGLFRKQSWLMFRRCGLEQTRLHEAGRGFGLEDDK